MKNLKTRAAAAAAILGLGGLTGLALSAGNQKATTLAAKPLVKTKVIHRTIRVTKHIKPKAPDGRMVRGGGAWSAQRPAAPATRPPAPPPAPPRPARPAPAPPLPPYSPVTTASSGASTARPDLRLGLARDAGGHPHQRLAPRLRRRPSSPQPGRYPHERLQRLAPHLRAAAATTARSSPTPAAPARARAVAAARRPRSSPTPAAPAPAPAAVAARPGGDRRQRRRQPVAAAGEHESGGGDGD